MARLIRANSTLPTLLLLFAIALGLPSAFAKVDLYTVCGRQEAKDGAVSFKVVTYNTLLPISQPVSPLDAVIPPKGSVSITGDCTYAVDSACNIVKKLPQCKASTCCVYSKRPFRLALNSTCTSPNCRVWASEFSGRCLGGAASSKGSKCNKA
ncbi:unnamed protein product [Closterium sp. Yama58-4]|nr:unnamed protein product [Closterium sp. Yama58-4]